MSEARPRPDARDDAAIASFWMAGYEGADHVNGAGTALDLAAATGHLDRLDEDHRRAAQAGLGCVRESIGWRVSESAGGAIDLSRARRIAESAERHGLQVAWSLMHYGLPDDLNLHDDALIPRFARFAAEVARVIGLPSRRPPLFTPINEIGFLAWAASQPGMLYPPNGLSWGEEARVETASPYALAAAPGVFAAGAAEAIVAEAVPGAASIGQRLDPAFGSLVLPVGGDVIDDDTATYTADTADSDAEPTPNDEPAQPAPRPLNDSSLVSGYAVKRRLARAAIAAMAAMRAIEPRALFLHIEPVVHVVAASEWPEDAALAAEVASWQWQAWDLIAGRSEPELGGSPQWLDLIGVNHYHSSQWELRTERRLDWHGRDPRRAPFSRLLDAAWQRYGRPVVVAETSHVGAGRDAWLHEMADEVRRARAAGVPVQGLCLYPALDRPDWDRPEHWHVSGLWHVDPRTLRRTTEPAYAEALRQWQRVLPAPSASGRVPQATDALPSVPSAASALPRLAEPSDAARPSTPLMASMPCTPFTLSMSSPERPVLLAFSHLRWEFVRHRTRQLLSRLASRWRIVFVEEPLPCDGSVQRFPEGASANEPGADLPSPPFADAPPPWLDCIAKGPAIEVLVPRLAGCGADGFDATADGVLHGLLSAWLHGRGITRFAAWLATPMALALARGLGAAPLVCDCSDDLGAFLGAPDGLAAAQRAALADADLVFAAGRALAEHCASAGSRLRLLPNGVDIAHFARARRRPAATTGEAHAGGWDRQEATRLQGGDGEGAEEAEERREGGELEGRGAGRVRVGFAGVVDERFDVALLDGLAVRHPDIHFVIVGPVVKIAVAALPRRPNIVWLGEQPYTLLPALFAGWRVALLPFGRHPATARANPLKVREYLAAGLPVVALALPDLAGLGPAGVATAEGVEGFTAALAGWLHETADAAEARRRRARRLLRPLDWALLARQADEALAEVAGGRADQRLRCQIAAVSTLANATQPR